MAKLKVILGLTAACAACCAAPLALPFILAAIGGVGLAGIGTLFAEWWLALAGLALIVVVALRRRTSAQC